MDLILVCFWESCKYFLSWRLSKQCSTYWGENMISGFSRTVDFSMIIKWDQKGSNYTLQHQVWIRLRAVNRKCDTQLCSFLPLFRCDSSPLFDFRTILSTYLQFILCLRSALNSKAHYLITPVSIRYTQNEVMHSCWPASPLVWTTLVSSLILPLPMPTSLLFSTFLKTSQPVQVHQIPMWTRQPFLQTHH